MIPLEDIIFDLDSSKLFYYKGSLTTPPCTEGVKWLVINDPLPISEEQVEMFRNKWSWNYTFAGGNGNNRKV